MEGRSNRKYTDEKIVAEVLTKAGYQEIYKPQELQSITAIEKLIGKKKFAELLEDLVEKPEGKPALVPETDKRPELNSVEAAAEEFEADDMKACEVEMMKYLENHEKVMGSQSYWLARLKGKYSPEVIRDTYDMVAKDTYNL